MLYLVLALLFTSLFITLFTMALVHADSIRNQLALGPVTVNQLIDITGLSQSTISRAINALGDEVVRIRDGSSIQYARRDTGRGFGEIPVYRVSTEGTIQQLGLLIPVRPDGFVMIQQPESRTLHSEGIPWWLYDMRPQGYLGRAYAINHAGLLGLPAQLTEWNDTHALRALLAHGHDAVGNLLLGDLARERFLSGSIESPVAVALKPEVYTRLSVEAGRGESPGSSAGGEQPKFLAYAETAAGARHVIVKFSVREDNPVTERWRDLLLAEHLALQVLNAAQISAVRTSVVDFGGQRFLEIERFDRVGDLGRRGLLSLAALDAEFVGLGQGWAAIAQALAKAKHIEPEAADAVALLQAIGVLIGNTDMHTGNLSFVTEQGRPYQLAPAYDMLPMAFAPKSGGAIPESLPEAQIHAHIAPAAWRKAVEVARGYLAELRRESGFSDAFLPCIDALERHIETASAKIARLAD